MGSYFRDFYSPTATQRPTVGDTKFSVINQDHMGWMKCDGRALSKTTYNILYQVVGDAFGSSATMFNLPNAVGRVPGAVGQSVENDWALGDLSGQETHTLIINEMPAHTHGSVDVTGNNNGNGITDLSGAHTHTYLGVQEQNVGSSAPTTDAAENEPRPTEVTSQPSVLHHHKIGSTGGGAAHNNMQPTIFMGNMFMFSGKVRPTSSNYYPYTYRAPIF
jgi:microcystin-dependent protein